MALDKLSRPTLLILAAGMGSRYGGLKQMDAFGPNGETILDYSIYDAINAGFGKIVFIIRESFKTDFIKFFANKFDDRVEVEFVTQELDNVPNGCHYHPERQKPWGTAHAVLVARDFVNEPFAVINADDYYGSGAYRSLVNFFDTNKDDHYGLVAYNLANTMSEHGTVNRGVCAIGSDNYLENIVETIKIGYDDDNKISFTLDDEKKYLSADTPVSMNMWAFYPDYFDYCEKMFIQFLNDRGQELKSEFFIPLLIDDLIKSGKKKVHIISCDEEWFGVTYQEDKPFVIEKLNQLIQRGVYPSKLWK